MPKRKVAVAISDWLLVELDQTAEQLQSSRSALVQEAVAEYVATRRTRLDEQAYRERALAAMEDAAAFADEVARDPLAATEPSSLEKLRALRAEGRGIGE